MSDLRLNRDSPMRPVLATGDLCVLDLDGTLVRCDARAVDRLLVTVHLAREAMQRSHAREAVS